MAPESQGKGGDPETPQKQRRASRDNSQESRSSTEDEDDDEEEEEPRLNYATLTRNQGPLYRNGDAVSAFLVGGDKMVVGTHNGNVHVFALPSFQSIRVYHAHTASVSAVSISPFPPPLPVRPDSRLPTEGSESPLRNTQSPAGKGPKQPAIAKIPSNNVYIATSSIDGNVCVCSLINPDDVILRKFGRPVQAVAVSPNYKSDRSYISGGKAGNLVLTVGGQAGKSATSSTASGAPLGSGWLESIGLGGQSGTDSVLHSGEGNISTIKWSLSGKFVAWVNEYGIKIMRTNLHLGSEDLDWAWKRVGHISRPDGETWDRNASFWTARAEWVDEDGLETDDDEQPTPGAVSKNGTDVDAQSVRSNTSATKRQVELQTEKLVIGWGPNVWVLNITDGLRGAGRDRRIGRIEYSRFLRLDCIVSGVSLYTPNLLIVLAYIPPGEQKSASEGTPKRGISRRQNALRPEMKVIDIRNKEPEEISADTLHVSRFESLTAADYHIGVLPFMRPSTKATNQKGTLEVLGNIGGTIWDASMYSSRLLGSAAVDATLYSAHLFTSSASVKSGHSSTDKKTSASSAKDTAAGATPAKLPQAPEPALLTRSLKIFLQSPYDCVLATKPTRSDHLKWLVEHERYEEAWNELDIHPDAAGTVVDVALERTPTASTPSTPTKAQGNTLFDFFDDSASSVGQSKNFYSQPEKEKRRIGDKWIQQLVNAQEWEAAGRVCGKVLATSSSWNHWVWTFAESNKHADIAPYIPTQPLRPPISSTVYEVILANYIARDRPRLAELLDRWSPDLFDITSVIAAMRSKLNTGEVTEDTVEDGIKGRDWRILMDGLAKLYLANRQTPDALRCYIRLQDADTALALIRTHHLLDIVADDIPSLILLRISKGQRNESSLTELDELASEPVRLLVSEAHHGIVTPEQVVKQLKPQKDMQPFLFFYFRALWKGDTIDDPVNGSKRAGRDITTHRLANEGKSLVNDFADTALELFAEYDRPLLFDFLKASQSYTLSQASSICEKRDYIPEFVYLLSKEGRTKKALFIIIEKLDDVSQAIAFAKEQDDSDLWDDLVNYSMNKPAFIRALLEEAGTAIDPITLVRKIPEGLEIIGLRESLTRMIKEFELQDSISEGAARVFRGEVATRMNTLRAGQKSGMRFDVVSLEQSLKRPSFSIEGKKARRRVSVRETKPGHCCGCGEAFVDEELYTAPQIAQNSNDEPEAVLSFPCFHAFHLSCLLRFDTPSFSRPQRRDSGAHVEATDDETHQSLTDEDEEDMPPLPPVGEARNVLDRGVGPKVTYAETLKLRLGDGGCPLEVHKAGQGTGEW